MIDAYAEGLTLIKYLERVFKNAPAGLLRKQLRKKNINLNKKKADGSEKLKENDTVQVYFSEDTILKFEGSTAAEEGKNAAAACNPYAAIEPVGKKDIIYEDDDILALNKAPGVLVQKAKADDVSLNEMMLSYLFNKGEISCESMRLVKPSVCNRLDRNTSGIVLCGKTMKGLQSLSEALNKRTVHKYYICIVYGRVTKEADYEGYLTKAKSHNQVKITKEPVSMDSKYICTKYTPLGCARLDIPGSSEEIYVSALRVLLVTGRSHQIRAHLASIKNPLVGDPKYGNVKNDKLLSRCFKVKRQFLHAHEVVFEDEKSIVCPLPEDMKMLYEKCLSDEA